MIYFEDVQLEQVRQAGPYLLSETEIIEFSSTWDPFDFHTNSTSAEVSLFEGLAASGVHSICIFNRLCHDIERLAVEAVVEHHFRYPSAARPGDALSLASRDVWVKDSKTRPTIGIVGGQSQLINQTGNTVLEVESVVFVTRRSATLA